jgi:hypothetical protein
MANPASAALPTCTSAVAQSIPQAILISGGGLATLIGVIGALVSDDYAHDFAIAAAVGLASSFAGGVWAASTISGCAAAIAPSMPPPVIGTDINGNPVTTAA